jgi:quinolinate synthase
MKRITLEKCIATLSDEWDDVLDHEVTVPPQIREAALRAVERMIE